MKRLLFLLALTVVFCGSLKAQSSRFYFDKVISNNKVANGLLYKVTKDSLIIQNDKNELLVFKPQEIKSVDLKIFKQRAIKNFFKDVKYEDSRYEKVPNSDVKVLKQGETEASLAEEISGRVMAGIFSLAGNALMNSVALTVYNDKIAKFKFNFNKSEYDKQFELLRYHSYSYIINPDTKAELAKLKAISDGNRANQKL